MSIIPPAVKRSTAFETVILTVLIGVLVILFAAGMFVYWYDSMTLHTKNGQIIESHRDMQVRIKTLETEVRRLNEELIKLNARAEKF